MGKENENKTRRTRTSKQTEDFFEERKIEDPYVEEVSEKVEPQVRVEYRDRKKSNAGYIVTIIVLILLLVGLGGTILLYQAGKLDFLSNLNTSKNTNTTLQHTKSVKTNSEGVYITDVSGVVDEVMPSIVSITSKTVIDSGNYGPSYFGYGYGYGNGGSYVTEGAGSGVIIKEDNDKIYILTNNHVVEDSTELSVKFIDDKSYDAKVEGVSERKDIAVLSIAKKDIEASTLEQIKVATLGNSDELKVGNGIIAIGNALGYGQSVTTGVVSAVNREVSTDEYVQDMIQIDAAINGGNSGGALLNSNGELVGINSIKYSNSGSSSSASIEGMGFAIPISDVDEIIAELVQGKNDEGGVLLGIEGYMTTSNRMNNDLPEGFYVSSIEKGSNADKSDLEIGNIITEIDGNKVKSVDTIKKVLNKKAKGDSVTLKVKYASKNEYKEKDIKVNLN